MIHEALRSNRGNIGPIPLDQQNLARSMRANIDASQRADHFMFFKWVTIQ